MIVACATDDGKFFVSRHFGDAKNYDIYQWRDDGFKYIETIVNTSEEENEHADPKKAKHIMDLLKAANVDVGLTKTFGPNIKRVKELLLPVIVDSDSIEHGLVELQKHLKDVETAIQLTEKRIYIDLRNKL